MTIHDPLPLDGCTPTPLASYLKALGVLRLISSNANHVSGKAADPRARGWWEDERFVLLTSLDPEALLEFFLRDYSPSPIIAPWNGRAGFLEGDAGVESSRIGAELVSAIQNSGSKRFRGIRKTVESLHDNETIRILDRLRVEDKQLAKIVEAAKAGGSSATKEEEKRRHVAKKLKEFKALLLPTLRSTTDPQHLAYVDVCYVLSRSEAPAPLLGSGGNDGSRDFGVNFAERLRELLDFQTGVPTSIALVELEAALFATGQRLDATGSMGQFNPGQGGVNATTGYDGRCPLNSWDVVLAMEGTFLFGGSMTRRSDATGNARAAFPFTFEPSTSGAGSLSVADPNRPRGEIWTPLWSKPATSSETGALFAEGRLTLGQRGARTGLDAARSVARTGHARGIASFERYSLTQPDTKMPYQATPLGRFHVPNRPQRDLAEDLEVGGWFENLRRFAGGKQLPAHARATVRRLEDALFQMASASLRGFGTRNALVALGKLVEWLVASPKARENLNPPPRLSSQWTIVADDGTPEFRVAAALAGLGLPDASKRRADPHRHAGVGSDTDQYRSATPMAAHFAPIATNSTPNDAPRLPINGQWSANASVVWGKGDLVSNMIAVLERRLVEASRCGQDDNPLASATGARLHEIAAFLSGAFDGARCANLMAGLIWVEPVHLPIWRSAPPSPLPFAYAALKPIFTPDDLLREVGVLVGDARLPIPSGLVSRLRAKNPRVVDEVVRIALARARSSGIPSPFEGVRGGRSDGPGRFNASTPTDRLAAALLIPIDGLAVKALINRAYPDAIPEHIAEPTEDTNNVA